MDITPLIQVGKQLIQSYGDGVIQIAEQRYQEPVLVTSDRTFLFSAVDMAGLSLENFADLEIVDPRPELVLFGCGASIQPLATEIRIGLKERGMVTELMPTGAACRTFNVLLSEQRRVAAVLFPV